MEKDNKYYIVIENFIKSHRKYDNRYETILDDIIEDVYKHAKSVISTVKDTDVINSYLQKLVAVSIISVPKRMNFHKEINHRNITAEKIVNTNIQQTAEPLTTEIPAQKANVQFVDKMINSIDAASIKENLETNAQNNIPEDISSFEDILSDNNPNLEPEIEELVVEDEVQELEPDAEALVVEDEVQELEPEVEELVVEDEVQELEPKVEDLVVEDEVQELEPDAEDLVVEDEVQELDPEVEDLVVEDEVQELDPDAEALVVEDEVQELEPDAEDLVVEDEVQEIEPDAEDLVVEDEVQELEPDAEDLVVEDEVQEIEPYGENIELIKEENELIQDNPNLELDFSDEQSNIETLELSDSYDLINNEDLPFDSELNIGNENTIDFIENTEDEGNSDATEENERDFKPVNYSLFNYDPKFDNEQIDTQNIENKLANLNYQKPELNILKIFDLKYKQNLSIAEIAEKLQIDKQEVILALDEIIELI